MFNIRKLILTLLSIVALLFFGFFLLHYQKNKDLPIVAIANYGPHPSLEQSLQGLKTALANQGLKENVDFRYEMKDVNFELSLISQMLTSLKSKKPAVIVPMSTPIAQNAKNLIKEIPLVFNDITDPVAAGLLISPNEPYQNITGACDKQNLQLFLQFAKKLLPHAKTVGLLYSSSEANDAALLKMLVEAGKKEGITVLPIAIDNARDIPFRMPLFKDKVDFIYVGVSGAIQPALPTIAAFANEMQIPLFNADSTAVKQGLALGSFGVDYYQVGVNAGNLVVKILRGEKVANLNPVYPTLEQHRGFINKALAEKYQIALNDNLQPITVLE